MAQADNEMQVNEMVSRTNNTIENISKVTKYCTTDLKNEFQFMLQTAVINVGTHPTDIG